jgi:hypothetical protein
MALDGTRLGDAIVTALETLYGSDPAMTPAQIAQMKAAWEIIGQQIVLEITTNAVVDPGTLNNPSGQPVSVTGGLTGTTTAPETIQGTGTIS